MAAYVVAQIEVNDWDKFQKYLNENPRVIAQYSGRYIARGGETAIFEGPERINRVVLIEFPSLEKAKEWYYSKEYQQIKTLRTEAASGSIIAIEGC